MERHEWSEKQKRALALRQAGLTYDQIAEMTGYSSAGSVYNAIKAAMASSDLGDKVSEQRVLEMYRIDALQQRWWREAMNGDLKAAKFVLQVMSARANLLGLKGLPASESTEDPVDELAARRDKRSDPPAAS